MSEEPKDGDRYVEGCDIEEGERDDRGGVDREIGEEERRDAAGAGVNTRPKKCKYRKKFVILSVIILVIIVLTIAFSVWHAQPSFCNAICHSPMDNYVEGYYSDDTSLAYQHGQNGVTCLDCHDPVISDQVSEGIAWIQGDYVTDEAGNIVNTSSSSIGTREFCLKCHDDGDSGDGIDWSDIVAATEDWGGESGVNPHDSHNGDEECSDCHSSHGQSVMACDKCHGWTVPDGWSKPALF